MTVAILLIAALFIVLLAWKGRKTLHEAFFPKLYKNVVFPEARFPAKDAEAFRKKTARGYESMKKAAIVICGITRDDAETLPLTIQRIEKTGGLFADYHVVIFENDSRDDTAAILRQWEEENAKVTILSESLRERPDLTENRFERLAYCRNRYLEHVENTSELDGSPYVMVVDMDLRGGWSADGIAASFAEMGWDAVAANAIGYHNLRRTYYDTWALKPPTVLKEKWLYRLIGEGWQFRRGAPLIPVESAFGGLALYRREALLGRRYAGTEDGREVCEHHALNADRGLRFFLNPSQITVIGTQENKAAGGHAPWRRHLSRIFLNW
jgi:glycosyltransferase involved in cell wall biosynthesis